MKKQKNIKSSIPKLGKTLWRCVSAAAGQRGITTNFSFRGVVRHPPATHHACRLSPNILGTKMYQENHFQSRNQLIIQDVFVRISWELEQVVAPTKLCTWETICFKRWNFDFKRPKWIWRHCWIVGKRAKRAPERPTKVWRRNLQAKTGLHAETGARAMEMTLMKWLWLCYSDDSGRSGKNRFEGLFLGKAFFGQVFFPPTSLDNQGRRTPSHGLRMSFRFKVAKRLLDTSNLINLPFSSRGCRFDDAMMVNHLHTIIQNTRLNDEPQSYKKSKPQWWSWSSCSVYSFSHPIFFISGFGLWCFFSGVRSSLA